jgi:hypothetical protein
MALMTSYLVTTKNVDPFFNSLIGAKAPERFTQKFLESLEFKSTNDRLFIGLLKGLGFIEESGVPTSRYYDFLDQTQSKVVLAEAITEAYDELFNVNTAAQDLSETDVKNKLRTLTQGKYTDNVVGLMAKTFKALVSYAAWGEKKPSEAQAAARAQEKLKAPSSVEQPGTPKLSVSKAQSESPNLSQLGLHYNIQIHLPESRDAAVYDALFKSLKDHLL